MAGCSPNRFQELVEEHQADLYRLAYSYMKNRDDALDVVQESILKGLSKLPTLRNEQSMRVWMTRIVVNESISRLRRRRPDFSYQEWDGPAEPEQNRDELVDLRRSLGLLDPKLRTVVVLRFFEDMKLEDITHVVRAPLSTVKSRLYRALAQLRVDLEQKEDL